MPFSSYICWVSVEGFDVPEAIPRMTGMSDALVRERIKVCATMGGLGCGEVCIANPFNVRHAQSAHFNCSVSDHCRLATVRRATKEMLEFRPGVHTKEVTRT